MPTASPQSVIVPRVGGWSIPVTFRDGNGNLVDLTAAGLTPYVDFYQPNFGRTTPCTVLPGSGAAAQAGQAIALVPASVVQTLLSPSSSLIALGGAFGVPTSGPCRVEAYVVDSQGTATPPVVAFLQPVDWRTVDPSALPAPPVMVVPVGPAGATGPKGDKGDAGQAGSADPQPVTLAGSAAAHQAVYLGPAGGLVASCDNPNAAGAVLGLLLASGKLGDSVPFSAGGVLTDQAWNWAPGPIFLGLNGALTQQIPPSAAFAEQLAVALSPTMLRMAVRPAVLIEVPAGFAGATYRDLAGGVEVLRASAQVPGRPNALIATGPDGFLPSDLLAPVSLKASRLAGGPHLASIPNGCFEDGFAGWNVSLTGTAQAQPDPGNSAVGSQSAYLRAQAAGDVAALASSPIPVGEGVPVYVAARARLSGGAPIVVLSAIFYDRSGNIIGQPAQVGAPLLLTTAAWAEVGGYMLPPPGTRHAAIAIGVSAVAGAVGSISLDELMIHRQLGGPAAWQVVRAARTFLPALGGEADAFLSSAGAVVDLLGGVPAPVGGALYRALDAYLHQVVGLPYPGVTQQLGALWIAAALQTPMASDAPTPPPTVVSAKTSLVVRAVKPTILQRGGTWSAFTSTWIGAPDDTDGTSEALNLDPVAAIGGILYGRLLGFLTSAPTASPAGLGQPLAQSQADLAAAWALAPTLAS